MFYYLTFATPEWVVRPPFWGESDGRQATCETPKAGQHTLSPARQFQTRPRPTGNLGA